VGRSGHRFRGGSAFLVEPDPGAFRDDAVLVQGDEIVILVELCAVAAGAAAGAGIAYLYGGGFREIAHTIVNALAIDSGLICDGAKASCAAKIATAVENGILGFNLFRTGNQFFGGDGIITKGVENTIKNVGRLAKEGMSDTDREIIEIMLGI
jgi:L-cysteine desulfidase